MSLALRAAALVAATIASKLDAWREDVVGAASATGHGLPRWPALATADASSPTYKLLDAVNAGGNGWRHRAPRSCSVLPGSFIAAARWTGSVWRWA